MTVLKLNNDKLVIRIKLLEQNTPELNVQVFFLFSSANAGLSSNLTCVIFWSDRGEYQMDVTASHALEVHQSVKLTIQRQTSYHWFIAVSKYVVFY